MTVPNIRGKNASSKMRLKSLRPGGRRGACLHHRKPEYQSCKTPSSPARLAVKVVTGAEYIQQGVHPYQLENDELVQDLIDQNAARNGESQIKILQAREILKVRQARNRLGGRGKVALSPETTSIVSGAGAALPSKSWFLCFFAANLRSPSASSRRRLGRRRLGSWRWRSNIRGSRCRRCASPMATGPPSSPASSRRSRPRRRRRRRQMLPSLRRRQIERQRRPSPTRRQLRSTRSGGYANRRAPANQQHQQLCLPRALPPVPWPPGAFTLSAIPLRSASVVRMAAKRR